MKNNNSFMRDSFKLEKKKKKNYGLTKAKIFLYIKKFATT